MKIDTLVIVDNIKQEYKINIADAEIFSWSNAEQWQPKEKEYKTIYIDSNLNIDEVLTKVQNKGVKVVAAAWRKF